MDRSQPQDYASFSGDREEPINGEGTVVVLKKDDVVKNFRTGSRLEKLTKGLGAKVGIEIAEGMKHLEKPVQAAKLASEAGLIVRTHMTILPHFKDFKKDTSLVKDYMGKVVGNFDIDTDSTDVQATRKDILKNVSKNRCHHVKNQYFDKVEASQVSITSPVPYITDAQWQKLVELWSSPRHKDACRKNKDNRTKVKFGQKTSPRCYLAHVHAIKEGRKVDKLFAVEMFKVTDNITKDGFSEEAKLPIVEMEKKMDAHVPKGEAPKSYVEVVAEVLTNKSTFLKNVDLQSSSTNKTSKLNAAVTAHVLDLEEKLQRSEHQSEAMREEMAGMKKKAEEAEATQALILRRAEENDARYAQVLALLLGKPTGNLCCPVHLVADWSYFGSAFGGVAVNLYVYFCCELGDILAVHLVLWL